MKRARVSVLIAAVLTIGLSGCASTALTASTPTPSRTDSDPTTPSAAPSATPSPSSDMTAIEVTATTMMLLDEGGVAEAQFEFADDDPAPFVAAVIASLGVAPEESTVPGGFEGAEFTTTYDWDGLQIITAFSPEQCDPECRGTAVVITAPALAEVPIRTASGIRVGDSVAHAESLGARATSEVPLVAEPVDPALLDSDQEATGVVLLDLDDAATGIVRMRASSWFKSFGNI